jgi:hypothetical protein
MNPINRQLGEPWWCFRHQMLLSRLRHTILNREWC